MGTLARWPTRPGKPPFTRSASVSSEDTTPLHRSTHEGHRPQHRAGQRGGPEPLNDPRGGWPRVNVPRSRRHADAGCACQTQHVPLLTFPGTQRQRHGLSPPSSGCPLTNTYLEHCVTKTAWQAYPLRDPRADGKKLRRRSTPFENNPESRLLPLLQGAGCSLTSCPGPYRQQADVHPRFCGMRPGTAYCRPSVIL